MFLFFYNFSAKKNERIKQEKKYTNQLEIFWKEVFKALKSAKKKIIQKYYNRSEGGGTELYK